MYSLPNINRLVQKYDKINTRYQTMDALERQEKDLKAKLEFADTLEERKALRAELRELRKKIFDTPVEKRSDSMRITLKSSDVITDSNNNSVVAAKQEVVPSAASRKRDDSAANERLARRTRRAQQMESAKVEIKQEEPAKVVENKKYDVPKQQPVANKFTIKTNGFKSNDIANKFEAKTNNDPTGGLRRTGTWSSANRMQSARNEAKTNETPSKFEPKGSVTDKFTLNTAKPQQNNVQQPAVTKTAPQSVKFNSVSAQIKDNESVTSQPAESAGNVNGSGLRRTATWSPGNRAQAPRGVSNALSKLGGPTKKTFGSSYVKGQEDFADSKKERNPYAVNKYTPVTPGVPADKTGMEVSMKPLNKLPTQIQSNNLDGLQKKTNRFTGASTGANNSFRSSNGFVISKKEPATSQREAGKTPGTFNRVGSSRGRPNAKEPATPEPPSSFGGDKPAQSAADRMAFFRQAAEDEKKKEEAKKEREKRRKEREEQAKKEEEERKKREEEEKKKAEEEKKEEESQDNSNAKKGGAAPCMKKREKKKVVRRTMSIGSIVLDWVQEMVKDYPVEVKNFSSSWNDGMVFCALIHRFNPDAFDFSTLKPENKRENFDLAFDTGAKVKNIPKLLDTEDMVRMAKPEPRSVQCYVQWIWSVFGPTSGYGLTPADVQK